MKKLLTLARLVPAIGLLFTLSGCLKDNLTRTYTIMRPVFANKAEVLADVKSGEPKQLSSPGKIFIRGRYLFVNEVNKGIHVIDNVNPSSPTPVSFISIPGNIDIAASGNYLYADFYTDMLTINITDPLNAKLETVTYGVFPERIYADGWTRPDTSRIIVDWITKDTTVVAAEADTRWILADCMGCFALQTGSFNSSKGGAIVPGIGGSMARFAVVDNYLYSVNLYSLGVYNIEDKAHPSRTTELSVGSNIETIYPFRNRLFIGSSSGIFMYNINDPANPEREGSFSHATACDPVVSDGTFAYVTLRSGNACQGTDNQLDILDVSDVFNPTLVKTYPLTNPHGVGKDGNLLFVCDGDDGLKIYDATDVRQLKMLKHVDGITAYDVIPWDGNLIVIGASGLYQYNYSDENNIKLVSTIKITKQ